MGDKTRNDFILWCAKNNIELSMTQSQSKFLDFLFKNQDEMNGIGNLSKIYKHFYRYIKYS